MHWLNQFTHVSPKRVAATSGNTRFAEMCTRLSIKRFTDRSGNARFAETCSMWYNVRYSKHFYFQMDYMFLRAPYLGVYRTVFNGTGVVSKRPHYQLSNDPGIIKNGSVYIKIWIPKNKGPSGNRQVFAEHTLHDSPKRVSGPSTHTRFAETCSR